MEKKKKLKVATSMEPEPRMTDESSSMEFGRNADSNQWNVTSALERDNYDTKLEQETQIIHNILPAVIWNEEAFTAHLEDDPESLETLMNSSPYFRELLKKKRALFLSKEAFKIFYDWKYPTTPPYRDKGLYELLGLRLVCSSWCSSLDQLLREELIDCKPILGIDYSLGGDGQATKFRNHFEESHGTPDNKRSPFMGKYVCVWSSRGEGEDEEHWNELFLTLQKYGTHIFHLKLGFHWRPLGPLTSVHYYLKMRQVLTLTPNLRSLYIFFRDGDDLTEDFLGEHLPPKLAYLERLEVKDVPVALLSKFLLVNAHISSLVLVFQEKYKLYDDVNLENLKALEIYNALPTNNLKKILSSTSWPLTKLSIYFHPMMIYGICWREAFEMISSSDTWGNNLEHLVLSLPEARHPNDKKAVLHDSLNSRLNLPKVKKLEMRMFWNTCAFDFLLGMESLEHVCIGNFLSSNNGRKYKHSATFLSEAEEKQTLQFVGFENRLHESNVWTTFERLKTVKIDNREYFRADTNNKIYLTKLKT